MATYYIALVMAWVSILTLGAFIASDIRGNK